MAKKSRSDKPADELKMEIVRSRERLARDLRGLRYELDFPARLRRSFRNRTVAWITAAAVIGTIIVVLPLRKKKVYVATDHENKTKPGSKLLEAGFILGALRIAATLLKPTITRFLAQKLSDYGSASRPSKKW